MHERAGRVKVLPNVQLHKAPEGNIEEKRQNRPDAAEVLWTELVRASQMHWVHHWLWKRISTLNTIIYLIIDDQLLTIVSSSSLMSSSTSWDWSLIMSIDYIPSLDGSSSSRVPFSTVPISTGSSSYTKCTMNMQIQTANERMAKLNWLIKWSVM